SLLSDLTGFEAATATAVPLAPIGSASTLVFSASLSSRLMYPRSVSPLSTRFTPASDPTSARPCHVMVGWAFWKASVRAFTLSRAPPPPFTMYWPAIGSAVGWVVPGSAAPPQAATDPAAMIVTRTVRKERIRALLMG